MSAPLRKVALVLLLPGCALAFFLGAYFYFYGGGYDAPGPSSIPFDSIVYPTSSQTTSSEIPQIHPGTLLLDGAHRNRFTKGELSSFTAKITARGHVIQFIGEQSLFGGFTRMNPSERFGLFEEGLRRASSLVVISPDDPFSMEEINLVERFVNKGGRLLLISDPTRDDQINSLAERFGVTFLPDYLYNTVEYDLNFQNIYVTNFRPDELTKGLRQVVLYTAGSVESSDPGLAYTDANTQSSVVKRIQPFYPIVKVHEDRVVAIGDLTFMVPPQDSILDNEKLISNIADFLTSSQRTFDLTDFPFFFLGDVDILLGDSSLFELGGAAKAVLAASQIESSIVGGEDITRDTLYLGLYEDTSGVAQYLELAGIRLDRTLRTPFTPNIDLEHTAFILLHQGLDRRVLAILGNSQADLDDVMDRLSAGSFQNGLVDDSIGVYRTP